MKTLTKIRAKQGHPKDQNTRQRNQRICQYLALVEPIAHFYANHSPEPLEDLRQVGLMGLLRASELYEPKRKIAFEAFAKPHIRGAMLHYLRDGAPLIRLPRTVVELRHRDQSSLTEAERMRLELVAGMQRPFSLDSQPDLNLETMAEFSQPEPCLEIENPSQPGNDPGKDVVSLLVKLEPKLRAVVSQVILAGWSYRRTAQKLGVSPMTVQRRLKMGLELLKQDLSQGSAPNAKGPNRPENAFPTRTYPNWNPAQFAVLG